MTRAIWPRRAGSLLLAALLIMGTVACGKRGSGETSSSSTGTGEVLSTSADSDDASLWDGESGTMLELEGSSIRVTGSGVKVEGTIATIAAAGTYVLSGTLDNGQIVVDCGKNDMVHLVLNGATISCSDSAPLYMRQAGKTILTLQEGTVNTVTDGESYVYADEEAEEPNAAVFSKDDLTINGGGTMNVLARFNNGIASKDTLKIVGGVLSVQAADDGLMGRDALYIAGGDVTVDAADDALKSTNDTDTQKGFVQIDGGRLLVTAGGDGIQALTSLLITGGEVTMTTGGGSGNASADAAGNDRPGWGDWGGGASDDGDEPSAKGLKSDDRIAVTGGVFNLDCSDDAIHSNNIISIDGGDFQIVTGDDGVHADSTLTVTGGTMEISKCYEGLEAANVTVSGGSIRLTASDDGVNTAGGNDGSSVNGRPGQNSFRSGGDYTLSITGGTLVVDAAGDGLDANGDIYMSGGVVLINGPTNSANGSLDYDGSFGITGGVLIAAGSAGMAQAPGNTSTQYAVTATLSTRSAGTLISLRDEEGNDVVTFAPSKAYQSVILCTPLLEQGRSYTLSTGGSCTGAQENGLYEGGVYSGGTEALTFTISDRITTVSEEGASAGNFGGDPGNFGGPGGFGGDRPGRF